MASRQPSVAMSASVSFESDSYFNNAYSPRSPTTKSTKEVTCLSAAEKRYKYLSKLFKFRQMDFEYAFWQALYLIVSPQKVYRNFSYRKHTKSQWARDDPAFLVLLSLAMFGSAAGFSLALGLPFVDFIKLVLWLVFFDCVGCGLLIATALWWLANRFLLSSSSSSRLHPGTSTSGACVEWAYAFDVHLNAFFPFLLLVHVAQLPILSFVVLRNALAVFLGNTCWLAAASYYLYITFLGYSNLPFLNNTRVFLTPFTILILVYALSIIFLWNATAVLVNFYHYRLG